MAFFDSGATYDSGLRYDEPVITTKPKPTHMRDLHIWLTNPFDDPNISMAELLAFSSDHLARLNAKPFEITLTNLLQQVSFPVPRYKSLRHQLFTQHANEGRSIIQQLDGLETLTGKFRVCITETSDGTDLKLLTWVEKTSSKKKTVREGSKLVAAYLKSGRPRELLDQALSKIQPLNYYETDLLERAKVPIGKNRRFFEMARPGRARV